VIHEKVHHAPRIRAWVTISSHGLLGQSFFEETVKSELHVSMLHNAFVSHLLATSLPLQTQQFMKDGTGLHTQRMLFWTFRILPTHVTSNRFSNHFAHRQNWLLNSPDLNLSDYFLWGFLKEKIFLEKL
jgi:hypothetical protein